MKHIRDILRLKLELHCTHRQIARTLGISPGAVGSVSSRFQALGIPWETLRDLHDDALERTLYGPSPTESPPPRTLPDFQYLYQELRRPGVTLELLHLEYLQKNPDGYRYSQFCEHYRRWLQRRNLSMRQVHRAGEKLFLDYSGKRPLLYDAATGEARPVELFVAVLGASSLTFARAYPSQTLPDWIDAHVRAFAFFGGVPALLVPDQLKSAVAQPGRYEPLANPTYAEMAAHYHTAILPARPRKPKDKAKVERAVQLAQRWLLARTRNERFFSLEAMNQRFEQLLDDLNHRPMRKLGCSRWQLFEQIERAALQPLPPTPYEMAEWGKARANLDYHLTWDHHDYSVPHALAREVLEIRATARVIEVFHKGRRVASHPRSALRGEKTTLDEHLPAAHRHHRQWTPSGLIAWGEQNGPSTGVWMKQVLESRPHPEQGYRVCLGLQSLARRYGPERLEAACQRALGVGALSYRHLESMLRHGLDRLALEGEPEGAAPSVSGAHENLRGATYYKS